MRSSVDSVFFFLFSGSSEVSRYPGNYDEFTRGLALVPLEDARGRKSPTHRKVRRFTTGRLAFNGRDASLLPTPIYMMFSCAF